MVDPFGEREVQGSDVNITDDTIATSIGSPTGRFGDTVCDKDELIDKIQKRNRRSLGPNWKDLGEDAFSKTRGRNIDWSGYSHDQLTIIRPATIDDMRTMEFRSGSKDCGGCYYIVHCTCGRELILAAKPAKTYRSCGCAVMRGLAYREGLSEEHQIKSALIRDFDRTQRSARSRCHEFNLTFESFSEMILKPCSYCGTLPRGHRKVRLKGRNVKSRFFCNGLDRIDSNLGYIYGNVATCCKRCNLAKNDMALGEFREWLGRAASTMRVSRGVMGASDWELDAASTG